MDYLGYIGYLCYKGYRCCKDSLGSMDYMGLFPLQEVNFGSIQKRSLEYFISSNHPDNLLPNFPAIPSLLSWMYPLQGKHCPISMLWVQKSQNEK